MPFRVAIKQRLSATSPACRAVVATRLAAPEREDAAFRALQFAQFTTTDAFDDPATLRAALGPVDGLDADADAGAIEDRAVREAYDVVVANLDPTLTRRAPADDPVDVLAAFPYPLTTAEVAAPMAPHLVSPDLEQAETALIAATADGRAAQRPLGDGALWSAAA